MPKQTRVKPSVIFLLLIVIFAGGIAFFSSNGDQLQGELTDLGADELDLSLDALSLEEGRIYAETSSVFPDLKGSILAHVNVNGVRQGRLLLAPDETRFDVIREWGSAAPVFPDYDFWSSDLPAFERLELSEGEHDVEVCLDPTNRLPEADESNNCLSAEF